MSDNPFRDLQVGPSEDELLDAMLEGMAESPDLTPEFVEEAARTPVQTQLGAMPTTMATKAPQLPTLAQVRSRVDELAQAGMIDPDIAAEELDRMTKGQVNTEKHSQYNRVEKARLKYPLPSTIVGEARRKAADQPGAAEYLTHARMNREFKSQTTLPSGEAGDETIEFVKEKVPFAGPVLDTAVSNAEAGVGYTSPELYGYTPINPRGAMPPDVAKESYHTSPEERINRIERALAEDNPNLMTQLDAEFLADRQYELEQAMILAESQGETGDRAALGQKAMDIMSVMPKHIIEYYVTSLATAGIGTGVMTAARAGTFGARAVQAAKLADKLRSGLKYRRALSAARSLGGRSEQAARAGIRLGMVAENVGGMLLKDAAESAAQAALNPEMWSRMRSNATANMGRITADDLANASGAVLEQLKAAEYEDPEGFLATSIENMSERFGGVLGAAIPKNVARNLVRRRLSLWLVENWMRDPTKSKAFARAGIHGPFSESLEERAGEAMRYMTGVDKEPTPVMRSMITGAFNPGSPHYDTQEASELRSKAVDDLYAELLGFGPLTGLTATVGLAKKRDDLNKDGTPIEQGVGATPAMLRGKRVTPPTAAPAPPPSPAPSPETAVQPPAPPAAAPTAAGGPEIISAPETPSAPATRTVPADQITDLRPSTPEKPVLAELPTINGISPEPVDSKALPKTPAFAAVSGSLPKDARLFRYVDPASKKASYVAQMPAGAIVEFGEISDRTVDQDILERASRLPEAQRGAAIKADRQAVMDEYAAPGQTWADIKDRPVQASARPVIVRDSQGKDITGAAFINLLSAAGQAGKDVGEMTAAGHEEMLHAAGFLAQSGLMPDLMQTPAVVEALRFTLAEPGKSPLTVDQVRSEVRTNRARVENKVATALMSELAPRRLRRAAAEAKQALKAPLSSGAALAKLYRVMRTRISELFDKLLWRPLGAFPSSRRPAIVYARQVADAMRSTLGTDSTAFAKALSDPEASRKLWRQVSDQVRSRLGLPEEPSPAPAGAAPKSMPQPRASEKLPAAKPAVPQTEAPAPAPAKPVEPAPVVAPEAEQYPLWLDYLDLEVEPAPVVAPEAEAKEPEAAAPAKKGKTVRKKPQAPKAELPAPPPEPVTEAAIAEKPVAEPAAEAKVTPPPKKGKTRKAKAEAIKPELPPEPEPAPSPAPVVPPEQPKIEQEETRAEELVAKPEAVEPPPKARKKASRPKKSRSAAKEAPAAPEPTEKPPEGPPPALSAEELRRIMRENTAAARRAEAAPEPPEPKADKPQEKSSAERAEDLVSDMFDRFYGTGPSYSLGGESEGVADPKVLAWATAKFGARDGERFAKWFGDSVWVNADGTPQLFYHGSDEPDITRFAVQRTAQGFFFAPDRATAEFYAEGESGRVYLVYLKARNVADFDDDLVFESVAREAIWDLQEERDQEQVREFAKMLYFEGYETNAAVREFFDSLPTIRDWSEEESGSLSDYIADGGLDEILDTEYIGQEEVNALVERIGTEKVRRGYDEIAPIRSEPLEEARQAYGTQQFYMEFQDDFVNAAQNMGYDAVIFNDPSSTGESTSVVVFDGSQAVIENDTGRGPAFYSLGDLIQPNRSVASSKRPVATFFSGIGTMEAALSGASAGLVVEYDPDTVVEYNRSHKTGVTPRSVVDVSPEEVRKSGALLFHASPECKNFSLANRDRTATDTDLASAKAVARVIREARPQAVTIENVPQYQGTELFKLIEDALTESGYKWRTVVMDAADLGAPQKRRRMLVQAVLNGSLPALPPKQAAGDWYEVVKDLLPSAPADSLPQWERGRLDSMIARGALDGSRPIITMGGSVGASVASAANDKGPAPTLKAGNSVPRIVMPDGRILRVTPRMMARLMSLPDSFDVPANPRMATRVLGNGIQGEFTRGLIQPVLDAVSGGSPRGVTQYSLQSPSPADEDRLTTALEDLVVAMGMNNNPEAASFDKIAEIMIAQFAKRKQDMRALVPWMINAHKLYSRMADLGLPYTMANRTTIPFVKPTQQALASVLERIDPKPVRQESPQPTVAPSPAPEAPKRGRGRPKAVKPEAASAPEPGSKADRKFIEQQLGLTVKEEFYAGKPRWVVTSNESSPAAQNAALRALYGRLATVGGRGASFGPGGLSVMYTGGDPTSAIRKGATQSSGADSGQDRFRMDPAERENAIARSVGGDNRKPSGPAGEVLRPSTVQALTRDASIPAETTNEQLRDITAMVDAMRANRRLFVDTSNTGTGKTFVAMGFASEAVADGRKVTYVTVNQQLIGQIRRDTGHIPGIDKVRFTTYSELRRDKSIIDDVDILIIDEAHSVRGTDSDIGKIGAEAMQKASMTVLASATIASNPMEYQFLEPTGIFEGESLTIGDEELTGFTAWAATFGATPVRYYRGKEARWSVRWNGTDEALAAARHVPRWFNHRAMHTQRDLYLPPDMFTTEFEGLADNPVQAERQQTLDTLYETAKILIQKREGRLALQLAPGAEGAEQGQLAAHQTNQRKRVNDVGKIPQIADVIQRERESGRNVAVLVSAKTDLRVGENMPSKRWREANKDLPAQERERYRTNEQVIREQEQWASRLVQQPEDKRDAWREQNPAPFAPFIYAIAMAAKRLGSATRDKSPIDLLRERFGNDIAVITGDTSTAEVTRIIADWRAGRGPGILVGTIDKLGTGYSLHAIDTDAPPQTLVMAALPWAPERLWQSLGRIVRQGMVHRAKIIFPFRENDSAESSLRSRIGLRLRTLRLVLTGQDTAVGGQIQSINDALASATLEIPDSPLEWVDGQATITAWAFAAEALNANPAIGLEEAVNRGASRIVAAMKSAMDVYDNILDKLNNGESLTAQQNEFAKKAKAFIDVDLMATVHRELKLIAPSVEGLGEQEMSDAVASWPSVDQKPRIVTRAELEKLAASDRSPTQVTPPVAYSLGDSARMIASQPGVRHDTTAPAVTALAGLRYAMPPLSAAYLGGKDPVSMASLSQAATYAAKDLMGRRGEDYVVMSAVDRRGQRHFFLQSSVDGTVVDPIANQYATVDDVPDYASGSAAETINEYDRSIANRLTQAARSANARRPRPILFARGMSAATHLRGRFGNSPDAKAMLYGTAKATPQSLKSIVEAIDSQRPDSVVVDTHGRDTIAELQPVIDALERGGYNYDVGVYDNAMYGAAIHGTTTIVRANKMESLPALPMPVGSPGWFPALNQASMEPAPRGSSSSASVVAASMPSGLREWLARNGIDAAMFPYHLLAVRDGSGWKLAAERFAAPELSSAQGMPYILYPGGRVGQLTPLGLMRLQGIAPRGAGQLGTFADASEAGIAGMSDSEAIAAMAGTTPGSLLDAIVSPVITQQQQGQTGALYGVLDDDTIRSVVEARSVEDAIRAMGKEARRLDSIAVWDNGSWLKVRRHSVPTVDQSEAGAPDLFSLDTSVVEARKELNAQVLRVLGDPESWDATARRQWNEYLRNNDPSTMYQRVPKLTTTDDVMGSASKSGADEKIRKRWKDYSGLSAGDRVNLRVDIPSFHKGFGVITVHGRSQGKSDAVLTYDNIARIRHVTFPGSHRWTDNGDGTISRAATGYEKTALRIARNEINKTRFATMAGEWTPHEGGDNGLMDEAEKAMAEIISDSEAGGTLRMKEWTQVGLNPRRHSYFFDRRDPSGRFAVISADEVIQVGLLVLAKNPVLIDTLDPGFTPEILHNDRQDFAANELPLEQAENLSLLSAPKDRAPVLYSLGSKFDRVKKAAERGVIRAAARLAPEEVRRGKQVAESYYSGFEFTDKDVGRAFMQSRGMPRPGSVREWTKQFGDLLFGLGRTNRNIRHGFFNSDIAKQNYAALNAVNQIANLPRKADSYAVDWHLGIFSGTIEPLPPKQRKQAAELFELMVNFQNLEYTTRPDGLAQEWFQVVAQDGKPKSFNHDMAALELQRLRDHIDRSDLIDDSVREAVRAALDIREEQRRDLVQRAIAARIPGFTQDALNNTAYYHQQVFAALGRVQASSAMTQLTRRKPLTGRVKSGIARQAGYVGEGYNTNFYEAEFEWVRELYERLKMKEILDRDILRPYDKMGQAEDMAVQHNREQAAVALADQALGGDPLEATARAEKMAAALREAKADKTPRGKAARARIRKRLASWLRKSDKKYVMLTSRRKKIESALGGWIQKAEKVIEDTKRAAEASVLSPEDQKQFPELAMTEASAKSARALLGIKQPTDPFAANFVHKRDLLGRLTKLLEQATLARDQDAKAVAMDAGWTTRAVAAVEALEQPDRPAAPVINGALALLGRPRAKSTKQLTDGDLAAIARDLRAEVAKRAELRTKAMNESLDNILAVVQKTPIAEKLIEPNAKNTEKALSAWRRAHDPDYLFSIRRLRSISIIRKYTQDVYGEDLVKDDGSSPSLIDIQNQAIDDYMTTRSEEAARVVRAVTFLINQKAIKSINHRYLIEKANESGAGLEFWTEEDVIQRGTFPGHRVTHVGPSHAFASVWGVAHSLRGQAMLNIEDSVSRETLSEDIRKIRTVTENRPVLVPEDVADWLDDMSDASRPSKQTRLINAVVGRPWRAATSLIKGFLLNVKGFLKTNIINVITDLMKMHMQSKAIRQMLPMSGNVRSYIVQAANLLWEANPIKSKETNEDLRAIYRGNVSESGLWTEVSNIDELSNIPLIAAINAIDEVGFMTRMSKAFSSWSDFGDANLALMRAAAAPPKAIWNALADSAGFQRRLRQVAGKIRQWWPEARSADWVDWLAKYIVWGQSRETLIRVAGWLQNRDVLLASNGDLSWALCDRVRAKALYDDPAYGVNDAASYVTRATFGDYSSVSNASRTLGLFTLFPSWNDTVVGQAAWWGKNILVDLMQGTTQGFLKAFSGVSRWALQEAPLYLWNTYLVGYAQALVTGDDGDDDPEHFSWAAVQQPKGLLSEQDRERPLIIMPFKVGDKQALIRNVTMWGDAWILTGAADIHKAVKRRAVGQIGTFEMIGEMMTAPLASFSRRTVSGANPFIKSVGVPFTAKRSALYDYAMGAMGRGDGLTIPMDGIATRAYQRPAGEVLARNFGFESPYLWARNLLDPSGRVVPRNEWWASWIVSLSDPAQNALGEAHELITEFRTRKGEFDDNVNPISAFRDMRYAAIAGDADVFNANYVKHVSGKEHGFRSLQSHIARLNPISRLKEDEVGQFRSQLTDDQTKKLELAEAFSTQLASRMWHWSYDAAQLDKTAGGSGVRADMDTAVRGKLAALAATTEKDPATIVKFGPARIIEQIAEAEQARQKAKQFFRTQGRNLKREDILRATTTPLISREAAARYLAAWEQLREQP